MVWRDPWTRWRSCDYFSFGYVPAPKTIYRGMRKVLPAHYLVASAEGLYEKPYWRLSFANVENRTEQEWSEMVREQLCEATRIRLMSEVPLGAFLSGGVDSSSVVALMSKVMNRPVTTCSIGFPVRGVQRIRICPAGCYVSFIPTIMKTSLSPRRWKSWTSWYGIMTSRSPTPAPFRPIMSRR